MGSIECAFDQLALNAIAGQLPNNSLIGPHRLSAASISLIFDCSSGRAGSAGVGSTVRRNTIRHISIIPSEKLKRIKQTMRRVHDVCTGRSKKI
jgi:hypothetical protein